MKYVDDYGHEFNSIDEVKTHAIHEMYDNEEILVEELEYYFVASEILRWIVGNPRVFEDFFKDHQGAFELARRHHVENYILNCEKIEEEEN